VSAGFVPSVRRHKPSVLKIQIFTLKLQPAVTKSSPANSFAEGGFIRIITFPRLCDPAEHFYSTGSSLNFLLNKKSNHSRRKFLQSCNCCKSLVIINQNNNPKIVLSTAAERAARPYTSGI